VEGDGCAELEALGRELAAVQSLERGLTASAAAMRLEADKAEAELGPKSADHVRSQADDLELRRERTTRRVKHIEESIRWRRKAMKG
jgi:hypothetical protein